MTKYSRGMLAQGSAAVNEELRGRSKKLRAPIVGLFLRPWKEIQEALPNRSGQYRKRSL